jgi:hypothetical protein
VDAAAGDHQRVLRGGQRIGRTRSSGIWPSDMVRGRSREDSGAAGSVSRSAGTSSTTGPGRPEVAAVKAMST